MSLARASLPLPCQVSCTSHWISRRTRIPSCIAVATYCATPQAEKSAVQSNQVQPGPIVESFLCPLVFSSVDSHVTVSVSLSAPRENAPRCQGPRAKGGADPCGGGSCMAVDCGPQGPRSRNPTGQIAVEQGSGLVIWCQLDRGPIAGALIMCCTSPPSWEAGLDRIQR
jgi:hypothetical protein